MNRLLAPLEPGQLTLLEVVSDPYLKHEKWPTFGYVSGELRKRRLDARELLRSMPRTRPSHGILSRGYGVVGFDRNFQAESDVWLTIAGHVHLPLLAPRCQSFLLALESLRRRLMAEPTSPFAHASVFMRNTELSDGSIGRFSQPFTRVLLGMLAHEPISFYDACEVSSDGSAWKMSLGQALLEFEGVSNVADYVARVVDITGGDVQDVPRASGGETFVIESASAYVAAEIFTKLRKERPGKGTFRVDKLVQLIDELNGCYTCGYAFSCHALLRALLDHLPPLFGYATYSQVANNLTCSKTDKAYLKRLGEFRNQADDVLHRQIGRQTNVLSMDDMPPRAALNALLSLAVARLQSTALE